MEAVAVTCCELGDQFYRGLRPEPETVTMEWDEFVEIGQRLAGISPSPASDGAIREAFIAGATAVHNEWLAATERDEGPPRGDPDFSEAASDYAALSAHAGDAAKESGGGAESSRTVCPLTDPAKYTGGTDASRLQASAGVAPGPPDTHAETISNQENFK
ncbi:hypothetical protein [Afipia felis]|nr:hypothetical protein [Afipia felis]